MSYTILHIDSSPLGDRSTSRTLSAKLVAELKAAHPGAVVTTRDFGQEPLPHLTGAAIGAFFTPPDALTGLQAETVKPSEQAIAEVMTADIIVIGAPMWNFGIPSSLKAWIDHIVRAGKTFKYGANGPEGLVPAGKKVVVVSARGGVYSSGPMAAFDHQETYLRNVLGFIGLTDVSFVRAEGIALGPEAAANAMQAAEVQLAAILKSAA